MKLYLQGVFVTFSVCAVLIVMQHDTQSAEKQTDLAIEIRSLREQVRHLNDLNDIRQVLTRYARGLDRHDVALESSAFWPDAQVNYGYYSGLRDAFVLWGNKGHETIASRHEHHISNQTVDIDGDVAHVESYVIYFLRSKDEKSTTIGGARYIDKMERRNGEWRISVREFLPDIMINTNSVFAGDFAKNMCPREGCGTWDRSDLSYRRPLNARKTQLSNESGEEVGDISIFNKE